MSFHKEAVRTERRKYREGRGNGEVKAGMKSVSERRDRKKGFHTGVWRPQPADTFGMRTGQISVVLSHSVYGKKGKGKDMSFRDSPDACFLT